MKKTIMGIALAGVFITAANAQTAAPLRKNDTNKDGKTSKEEYLAGMEKAFVTRDADKDGFLTGEELLSNSPPADKDKDGKVSKEEYLAIYSKTFDAMDKDKDGFLTGTEGFAPRKAKAKE
jgi:Ca2+-binding EF-hand superfamily protein